MLLYIWLKTKQTYQRFEHKTQKADNAVAMTAMADLVVRDVSVTRDVVEVKPRFTSD